MYCFACYRLTGKAWAQGSALFARLPFTYRMFSCTSKLLVSVQEADSLTQVSRTRNIGIIAHIDAGKTTTTERMLYYSGYTHRLGNVDDGSTVTDFLPAERRRGITIQSASISFRWSPSCWIPQNSKTPEPYTINLIDTPGHADFTFEVLRSLRVLDGAICILDGVAGVEAQTEKVWSQARTYGIPAIIFVNKLDRIGAKFGSAVRDIASKLHAWPAVCQLPWFENGKERFQGVIDVVELRALKWTAGGDGKTLEVIPLAELELREPELAQEARRAREQLLELLSERDDALVEKFLDCNEDYMEVPPEEVWSSLRRCILSGGSSIVPVFAGASFRNIGVQPVLDAVSILLPNPNEAPDPSFRMQRLSGGLRDLMSGRLPLDIHEKGHISKTLKLKNKGLVASVENLEACALAFKVVNDTKHGVLVYVRVYHGSLKRGSISFNTTLQISERMPRLLKIYASDTSDVSSISAGEIGVITGLKYARTGDTLISYTGLNPKNSPPSPLNELQLRPIEAPPPVFFTAVEPHNAAEERFVEEMLALLLREDPSLHVSTDDDSGQKLLSGMGELHLEIASNRLVHDLKAKATTGAIEIAYRECPRAPGPVMERFYDKTIAGAHGRAGCEGVISPLSGNELIQHAATLQEGNFIEVKIQLSEARLNHAPSQQLAVLKQDKILQALSNGAISALARGPTHAFAVHGAKVELVFDTAKHFFGADSTDSAISRAARDAINASMKASASTQPFSVVEPVMKVAIDVDQATLGPVLNDLSGRDGQIEEFGDQKKASDAKYTRIQNETIQIDVRRVYAPPDPFEGLDTMTMNESHYGNRGQSIIARVPLKEMMGYLKHLRSLTAGKGTFTMEIDGFRRMAAEREKAIIEELRGP